MTYSAKLPINSPIITKSKEKDNKLLTELISWIKQGNKQLEKSSPNVIEKVYDEWMTERNKKASAALCDLVISKFTLLLGGLDTIEYTEYTYIYIHI